jgi:hypothetical protein
MIQIIEAKDLKEGDLIINAGIVEDVQLQDWSAQGIKAPSLVVSVLFVTAPVSEGRMTRYSEHYLEREMLMVER